MQGELERAGGRARLRFRRRLGHSPEVVWRAITEPEHLAAWFPDRLVVDEWGPGARLRFETGEASIPGFEGEVAVYEPPRVLEFTWGTDLLRFELEGDGQATVLTLLHTFDEQGKAARDGAGWHACLDQLQYHLEGQSPPWSPGERWQQLHPEYVARLGPEASTIGPPEGHPLAEGLAQE